MMRCGIVNCYLDEQIEGNGRIILRRHGLKYTIRKLKGRKKMSNNKHEEIDDLDDILESK